MRRVLHCDCCLIEVAGDNVEGGARRVPCNVLGLFGRIFCLLGERLEASAFQSAGEPQRHVWRVARYAESGKTQKQRVGSRTAAAGFSASRRSSARYIQDTLFHNLLADLLPNTCLTRGQSKVAHAPILQVAATLHRRAGNCGRLTRALSAAAGAPAPIAPNFHSCVVRCAACCLVVLDAIVFRMQMNACTALSYTSGAFATAAAPAAA